MENEKKNKKNPSVVSAKKKGQEEVFSNFNFNGNQFTPRQLAKLTAKT